jgi:hypothetical protein
MVVAVIDQLCLQTVSVTVPVNVNALDGNSYLQHYSFIFTFIQRLMKWWDTFSRNSTKSIITYSLLVRNCNTGLSTRSKVNNLTCGRDRIYATKIQIWLHVHLTKIQITGPINLLTATDRTASSHLQTKSASSCLQGYNYQEKCRHHLLSVLVNLLERYKNQKQTCCSQPQAPRLLMVTHRKERLLSSIIMKATEFNRVTCICTMRQKPGRS